VKRKLKRTSHRTYLVVFQVETDGDIVVREWTKERILEEFPGDQILDALVIEGRVVKPFDTKW